jgi:hypothetical protein
MTTKRKILIGLPLLLVLLLVAGYLSLDHLAKAAIEVGGARAMGVPVSVGSVKVSPFAGRNHTEQLVISNPKGFETPFFMSLSTGDAALEVGSLFEDTVVVNSIELSGLKAHLEKTKEGSNYEVILANMQKGEEEGAAGEEGGKKFLAKRIVIRDIAVRADLAIAGEKLSSVDLQIDEILLENVGSDTEGGKITSQVMHTIVKAVLAAILEQGARVLPEVMVNGLGAGLKGLGKVGFKVVGNVTVKVGGKVIKVLGGAGKTIGGVVDGIFGGGDDEDEEEEDK